MIKLRSLKAHQFKQLKEIRIKFPEHGSVLVEGRNEAGKSTLFEAVYFGLFGDALVTEDNHNDLKDLIEYNASMAVVELGLEVRGRHFNITRTINREKPNAWRLRITNADGSEELVRANSAVDKRIISEIGLDGDALLNSCFVEQKKLEKLESLNAGDRRKSLLRILNLEALEVLQSQFKRQKDDDFRHIELRDRVKLARILEEIPAIEIKKAELEQTLALVEINRTITIIEERQNQIAQAKTLIQELSPQREELQKRLERALRLKEGQQAAEKITINLQRISEQAAEIVKLEKRVEELTQLEDRLPEMKQRMNSLQVLSGQISRHEKLGELADECRRELNSLQEQIDQAQKLRVLNEELISRIKEALQQIESDQIEEKRLAERVKYADQREMLEGWRRTKSTVDGISLVEAQEQQIQQKKAHDETRHQQEKQVQARYHGRMVGSIVSSVIVLIAALVSWFGLRQISLAGVAVTGFVSLVYLTISHYHKSQLSLKNLKALAETLQSYQDSLLRLEGQKQSLASAGEAGEGRLAYYEESLCSLGIESLETIEECETILARLESQLENEDASSLRSQLSAVREKLAGQEAALHEMQTRHRQLQQEMISFDETALQSQQKHLQARLEKTIQMVDEWSPKLEQKASALNLSCEVQVVRDAAAVLRGEIERDQREIDGRTELLAQIEKRRTSLEQLHLDNEAAYPPVQMADQRAPEWSREITAELCRKVALFFGAQVQELDEIKTTQDLRELERRSHAADGEIETHTRDIQQQTLRMADLCRRINVLLPEGEINRAALVAKIPGLKKTPTDPTQLRLQRDQVAGDLVHKERQRDELTAKLRLDGVDLAVEACEKELNDFERELRIRLKAEQIVKQAREQLVSKVLPGTIEHMRRILPVLTMDRYHDAEITEDYRIKAWDERAGSWKAKNIYSGGTRDQFSLALRLSFALATLPQERGTAPGFIFLDEPLSSFDSERSLALMELLTVGEIAEAFDQIFVVSHSQVLDPTMFHHHLVLDGGQIVSSTLEPLEEETPTPAA